jgi:hypothetical protein
MIEPRPGKDGLAVPAGFDTASNEEFYKLQEERPFTPDILEERILATLRKSDGGPAKSGSVKADASIS